ncbi:hypothetical protein I4U23_027072 [Adineta vaga]|nr:hypothetical protein I4U23_027072 [Adineta vaga]
MVSNTSSRFQIEDYYIVCSLSTLFAIVAILISLLILFLVWHTKPRLHTINHLLICNTAIASILYCLITINNYIYLIFISWNLDEMSCRYRAYFGYVGIASVIYSYLIQAISRLFFSVFSTKYRFLTTFKVHFILIGIQWFIVILIPLSILLTKDIQMTPLTLCWIPLSKIIHLISNAFSVYFIPVGIIIFIYIYIFYHVHQMTKNVRIITNSFKRDLQLLRNILILLSIYLGGSITTLLYMMTSIKIIYLSGLVAITLTVTIEKIFTLILDREIREVITNMRRRITPVVSFQTTTITLNK